MSRALTIPEPLRQRQARASDPKTSAWVSANAGSGKTHLLTQRVLRLLLNGTPPGQILCLAYTKAAAANMADRVFSKLALWTSLSDNALAKAIVECGADAPGPREPGAFGHIALRVNDLAAARAKLPVGAGEIVDAGEGVRVMLVEGETDVDYDLDHVVLLSADPQTVAAEYERYGFVGLGDGRVEVGGAYVELREGTPPATERPLLNHLAVLVDSADEHVADAHDLGIEVESIVDAANTYAVFLSGPEGVRIEYVEHKPTFSLT